MPPDPLFPVSRETEEKFQLYEKLLVKWQASINLVSPSTIHDIRQRHINDSLQLRALLSDHDKIIFDMGAGAGFPGLVLAIAKPALDVYLIESDSKKCSFLRAVSRETGVAATVINSRIEDFDPPARPDVITARALAPLGKLLDYSQRFAQESKQVKLLFLKGKNKNNEIIEAKKLYRFDLIEHSSYTAENSCILEILNCVSIDRSL